MSEERFARIETTLEEFRGRFDGIDPQLDDLGRHMRVLHEDIIDRIQSIADPTHAFRREFRAADAELLESVNRRLDPLEVTVRDHSALLEKRRQSD